MDEHRLRAAIPRPVDAGTPPKEVQAAAKVLVAQALREKSAVYNITLHDLTYDGQPIGTYEVSVRRLTD